MNESTEPDASADGTGPNEPTTIPLTIVARNEARAIGACLDSLLVAREVAEAAQGIRIAPLVIADDCTDDTAAIARGRGVPVRPSTGGKVEALRAGARPGPFQIFSDADVLVTPQTLEALCEVMRDRAEVAVAFPPKRPLPPRRRTPLARACHVYNLRRGFSSQRTWFSGKLFAIRRLELPSRAEVAARARALPEDRFYDYAAGLRVDDVYLSRRVVLEHGVEALVETERGELRFAAPETLRGIYRYYRRMRMELERLDRLFPETATVHATHGRRRPDLLPTATPRERRAWRVFATAILGCRVLYRAERWAYQHLSPRPCDPWPPIEETKELC